MSTATMEKIWGEGSPWNVLNKPFPTTATVKPRRKKK